MSRGGGCCGSITDVICNRQATFVDRLRDLRPYVERTHMRLLCFKSDLERRRVTRDDLTAALEDMKVCSEKLDAILGDVLLNIVTGERRVIRQIHEELGVLSNHIHDIDVEELAKITSQLDRYMIGMVSSVCENLREFMRWEDEKTERRWWLVDFIQFLQIFIKLALFISAAVSVVYHTEQVAPIITLGITILQGVVELLDQFFVRGLKPKEIKLSLISTDRNFT